MPVNTAFDAYSPREIAEQVRAVCVAKAATPLLSLVMLGVLAGAFIGLGALFSVIVLSDPALGFAAPARDRRRGVLPRAPARHGLGAGFAHAPVIAGNLVGGSVLVALAYHVIYRRPSRADAAPAPRSASELR